MKPGTPGTVIQIDLPNGRFAYGRLYRDAAVGIYSRTSELPANPPIGSRDFQFIVGVYDEVITSGKCPIVGEDPFTEGEDSWPPPQTIIDPITGKCSIYHRGEIRPALPEECERLETAAVWDLNHLVDRIINGDESRYLRSVRSHAPVRKSTIQ